MQQVPKVIGRLPRQVLNESMWVNIHIINEFRDQPILKVIEYEDHINVMYAFTHGGFFVYLLYSLTPEGEPIELGLNVLPRTPKAYPGPSSLVAPLEGEDVLATLREVFAKIHSAEYTRIAAGDIEIMK